MRGLLRVLREQPDAVEADLARYYGTDIRDRWRRDENNRPLLTLRQIMVRIRHLPIDSACVAGELGGERPWSRTEHLLDELRLVLLRLGGVEDPKPHPGRKPKRHDPTKPKRLAAARARLAARRRRLAERREAAEALTIEERGAE